MDFKMGWLRDLPDVRDYQSESPKVKAILDASIPLRNAVTAKTLPAIVDLRQYCSPVEDQGNLGSCTANAGVGLIEYYQRRAFNKYINGSRLFLYKTSRDLMGIVGDQGSYLRTTMKSMVLFGVPPEDNWPYNVARFDAEPTAFIYAYAGNFKSIQYYRLDPAGTSALQLLSAVKTKLIAGLPSMFGFTVYNSIDTTGNGNGDIPYPGPYDYVVGGHAVDVVGYSDNKTIGGRKGALLIRNSWGTSWGEKGYGWLPYDYVLNGLAADFWSLVQAEFVDTDLFK